MTSRTRYLFGTWKNKLDIFESIDLLNAMKSSLSTPRKSVIGICPSAISLATISSLAGRIPVASQNCGWHARYSLTGEMSSRDLVNLGVRHCIVGHSERRTHLSETETTVGLRLRELFGVGIVPIVCIGEGYEDREAGDRIRVLTSQLSTIYEAVREFDATLPLSDRLILAYEPMWAISTAGTGEVLDPKSANDVHLQIRSLVDSMFGDGVGGSLSILYGGSVNGGNALGYFSQPDIDGGLVGTASQSANEFARLVDAFDASRPD